MMRPVVRDHCCRAGCSQEAQLVISGIPSAALSYLASARRVLQFEWCLMCPAVWRRHMPGIPSGSVSNSELLGPRLFHPQDAYFGGIHVGPLVPAHPSPA